MLDLTNRQNCFYWQTDRNLSPEDYKRIFLQRNEISTEAIINILKRGIKSIPNITNIEIIEPDENVLKGNVNIVRKVKINEKEYIVRMHPQGVKNGYFYVEKLALEEANKKNIPAPKVLEIHEAEDEKDMDFALMTVCPGITMDIFLQTDKSNEKELLFDCGRKMAEIHKIKIEGFGCFDNQLAKNLNILKGLHDTYHDFIHTGLQENLERLIKYNIIDQEQSDKMYSVFEKYNFEPTDRPRIVHNDFADWNLLTDGKTITGVLDWDECHAGDPIADLACWSTFFDIKRMDKFMEGYLSVSILPDDYDTRFHFYRLRYTISKMALRAKRYIVDQSPFIIEKLEVGKRALEEETKWFGI